VAALKPVVKNAAAKARIAFCTHSFLDTAVLTAAERKIERSGVGDYGINWNAAGLGHFLLGLRARKSRLACRHIRCR
jgi:hypothetical protein